MFQSTGMRLRDDKCDGNHQAYGKTAGETIVLEQQNDGETREIISVRLETLAGNKPL